MPNKFCYGQVQRSAMNWPFFAAAELNLFAEQNLAIEPYIYTAPPDPVAALTNGSLDLINVIPDITLMEMVKGALLALIANTNSRAQYRLMADAEIRDCTGLEGKKIGVNDGRSAESLILKRLLKKKRPKARLLRTGSLRPAAQEMREAQTARDSGDHGDRTVSLSPRGGGMQGLGLVAGGGSRLSLYRLRRAPGGERERRDPPLS